jgi:hypothetical protein
MKKQKKTIADELDKKAMIDEQLEQLLINIFDIKDHLSPDNTNILIRGLEQIARWGELEQELWDDDPRKCAVYTLTLYRYSMQ